MPMSQARRLEYMRNYYKNVIRPRRIATAGASPLLEGICQYCGKHGALDLDHIIPKSKGGTDAEANLRPSCRLCNMSKGDREVDVWRATLARKAAGVPDFSRPQRAWLEDRFSFDPYNVDPGAIKFWFEGGHWTGVR